MFVWENLIHSPNRMWYKSRNEWPKETHKSQLISKIMLSVKNKLQRNNNSIIMQYYVVRMKECMGMRDGP